PVRCALIELEQRHKVIRMQLTSSVDEHIQHSLGIVDLPKRDELADKSSTRKLRDARLGELDDPVTSFPVTVLADHCVHHGSERIECGFSTCLAHLVNQVAG